MNFKNLAATILFVCLFLSINQYAHSQNMLEQMKALHLQKKQGSITTQEFEEKKKAIIESHNPDAKKLTEKQTQEKMREADAPDKTNIVEPNEDKKPDQEYKQSGLQTQNILQWLKSVASQSSSPTSQSEKEMKVFQLKSGEKILGMVKDFNDSTYSISTNHGLLRLKEAEIISISSQTQNTQDNGIVAYKTQLDTIINKIISQASSGLNMFSASEFFANAKVELDQCISSKPEYRRLGQRYQCYFLLLKFPFAIQFGHKSQSGKHAKMLVEMLENLEPLEDEKKEIVDDLANQLRQHSDIRYAAFEEILKENTEALNKFANLYLLVVRNEMQFLDEAIKTN